MKRVGLTGHGGQRLLDNGLDKGTFFAPTVLSEVNDQMLIYREETFGPVAAIVPYETNDDVIAMANDTNYGLAAYVYTRSISRAWQAMEKLRFDLYYIKNMSFLFDMNILLRTVGVILFGKGAR